MGGKHAYATIKDLQRLVTRMRKTGILYSEALRQFEKQFFLAGLNAAGWNHGRTAKALGMHRNTFIRNLRASNLTPEDIGGDQRRPPRGAGAVARSKLAG